MKKFLSCLILFSFVLNQSVLFSPALAATNALKIKAADGSSTVYGSVLKPSQNRLKVKIPSSLLKAIRSSGIESLTVSITKIATEGQESSVYSIPSENLTLVGKQLLIDLLPCLDTAGSTVTAGALSNGSYSFQIASGDSQFSGSFDFKAPAVVVGTVDTGSAGCGGGTNTINSLSGSSISGAVALSNTCTFFNEVQAARTIKAKKKNRFLFQDTGEIPAEDTFVYVDPVTETEQTIAEVENVVVIEDPVTGESEVVEASAPVDLVGEAGGDTEVVVNAGSTQEYDNAVDNADANNNGEIDTPAEVQALENDLSDNTSSTSSSGATSSSTSSSGSTGNNELKPIQDPKAICDRLREGIGKLKDCKGSDCPKPPCFPDDLRAKLKEVCAELLALIPAVKCERPQAVCGLQGGQSQQPGGTSGSSQPIRMAQTTSGQPSTSGACTEEKINACKASSESLPICAAGTAPVIDTNTCCLSCKPDKVSASSGQPPLGGPGQPNAGPGPNDGQCMDFRPPQQPSICKLCNTAGPEGCTGPELKTVTSADGSKTCVLPEVQCIPFTSLGKTSPDAKFDGVCLFGDGDLTVGEEDDKPKDPRTCEPFKFDPGLACSQFRPSCKPSDDLSTIEKACCQLPPPPGGNNGSQPNQDCIIKCKSQCGNDGACVESCVKQNCSQITPDQIDAGSFNIKTNECVIRKLCSDPSNFGVDGKPDSTKLESLKAACSGQGQPGGMSGQPKPDPACIEGCKSKCGTDQACLQECGKTCQPTDTTSSGGTSGQPKPDPACIEGCKSKCGDDRTCLESCGKTCQPTGGTSGQIPCDPAKDPNCKPPTSGECPQGQVKDPTTGQCSSGGISECKLCPDGKTCDNGNCPQVVCPTGQVLCSDGKTCKTSTVDCPQGGTTGTTFQCPSGTLLCPNTKDVCVTDTSKCPPPAGTTACPDGKKKCSDGSCQTTCP